MCRSTTYGRFLLLVMLFQRLYKTFKYDMFACISLLIAAYSGTFLKRCFIIKCVYAIDLNENCIGRLNIADCYRKKMVSSFALFLCVYLGYIPMSIHPVYLKLLAQIVATCCKLKRSSMYTKKTRR